MAILTPHVLLSLGFAVSASLTVAAHGLGRRSLVYVFKPLSTGLLLVLVASGPSCSSSPYAIAILAGLLFSLLGDVFLMLPKDHFRSGLVSFLVAHACYVLAFLLDRPFTVSVVPFGFSFAVGALVLPALWNGIPARLRAPVVVYMALLLVMASLAGGRAMHLRAVPAVCASVGASLFVLSDSILAWARFRRPFPAAQVLVHGTYFPAQWLIAVSSFSAWPVS